MSLTQRHAVTVAQTGAPALPVRPVVMWAPFRYGVFSWLQSQDQQIAETVDFLRGEILKGVTDGSAAAPGQIGEVVGFNLSIPYPEAHNVQLADVGTLAPGDWDFWALAGFDSGMVQVEFNNIPTAADPLPSPPPNFPQGVSYVGGAVDVPSGSALQINTNVGIARIAVPTLMQMRVTTTAEVGSGGGTMTLAWWARRRR